MKHLRALLVVLIALVITLPAFAGTKGGVTMPDSVQVAGKQLVLNGMGIREATILNIDVYVAGLYLETKSSDGAAIAASKQNKQLVLKFVRDVDRADIVKAWSEGFAKSGKDRAALQARIDKLNGWMGDMKVGQHLTFTVANGSVEVNVNGSGKGSISGDDFAEALMLIWLGNSPPNKGLKKGLLGQ